MADSHQTDIDERDGEWLLSLARRTLERLEPGSGSRVPDEAALLAGSEVPPAARRERGVFVTLHKQGVLRGCIGYVMPRVPLYRGVIENAVNAARRDPRFPPVALDEVGDLRIEISTLEFPRKIEFLCEIEIGRHGLIASRGFTRGLLLPQVPVEYGWDWKTFIDHTCLKAGLPRDAWQSGDVAFEAFSASVFSEEK